MCSANVQKLMAEIELFKDWAKISPKGTGEWETEYINWNHIYDAVKQVFEHVPIEQWDLTLQKQLLYILARDNEMEEIVGWLVKYPGKFLKVARTALTYDDWNARWQIAHYLYKLQADDNEIDSLILKFMSDQHEYVRRRAMIALSYRQSDV